MTTFCLDPSYQTYNVINLYVQSETSCHSWIDGIQDKIVENRWCGICYRKDLAREGEGGGDVEIN